MRERRQNRKNFNKRKGMKERREMEIGEAKQDRKGRERDGKTQHKKRKEMKEEMKEREESGKSDNE